MALFLWQYAFTSNAWREQITEAAQSDVIAEYGVDLAEKFGGKVLGSWLAFGEYDIIKMVMMPDNESMAAYVLAMIADGRFSAGKTTVMIPHDEAQSALNRAGEARGIS